MKNTLLLTTAALFLFAAEGMAQVGVNTANPKTSMDVSAKRDAGGAITDNTQVLGLQAPRVTLAELTSNTATYGPDQTGAFIYITDVSAGTATGQRVNIDEAGYYSFDGSVWQKVLYKNVYNADGSLVGPGGSRTLTLNGKEFNITGPNQRSSWRTDGVLYQENRQGAGGSGAIVVSGGNSSNLFLQQFYNGDAQVQATSNSTALNLSTHGTTASAPVTISTSVGGGALSTEKMRVTGEGNVGISTITPQVTLDVAGTPAATSVLDGIRAPRLTGDQLRAKVYTINQLAAIVYVTSGDSAPAGQTINVTTAGYYYFDGAAWQRMKIGDLNIYNSNGSLTSARTLTQAGFSLTFTNAQSTIFSNTAGVGIRQDSGTGTRASMALSNGGAVQMWLWSDTNAAAQVLGTGNSTSLLIGTTTTQAATPIIFQTSTGGGLVGTEKMRLLSNGNLGIGTAFASEKLDVDGNTRLRGLPLNGATNAIYTQSNGTASATQNQTFTATRTVVADANGVLGYVTGVASVQATSTDATRYLGGTIYARFNSSDSGTLVNAKVIGGATGTSYTVGSLSATSSKGGINSVIGNGYTISNPSAGIFDIRFDTALTEIYGISVNIVDAYGPGPSALTNPNPATPGAALFTNDNTQVSFISNTIIRIKTGNSNGDLSNRSFTFLVTGK